jgi:hypothetical protein
MSIKIPIVSDFDGAGVKKAIAEFKQLETTGQKAQFALKKAALPAAAAFTALAGAIGVSVKSAMDDAAAQAQLARQLENSTGASAAQVKQVEALIGKMSVQAAVADDQLRPAYANLARNTRDLDRANYLLSVAMDVSAATGKDLESVTIALGKAENGQYTALKKLGIPMGENADQLNELAKENKKLLKAQNELMRAQEAMTDGVTPQKEAMADLVKAQEKVAKAQAIVNELNVSGLDFAKDLEEQFAGMAETAANTADGGMKRLQISLGEASESLGAAFLPVVQAALPFLQKFADWAMENPGLLKNVVLALGALTGAIVAVNVAMSLNPAALVAGGIVAVGVALVAAYKKFQTFRTIVDALFDGLRFGFELVKTYFTAVFGFYKTLFNGIASAWNNTVGKLAFTIPSWVPFVGGKGFDVPDIPMLADGGIVTGPTMAIIGEKGPEAVVPLDRMGGMGNVTINVNGGDPEAVVQALRRYMNRYGNIPIRTTAP